MKCEGKCHLDKIMKEDTKRDSQNKSAIRELSEISACTCRPGENLQSQIQSKPDLISFYLLSEPEKRVFSFFHPPSGINGFGLTA